MSILDTGAMQDRIWNFEGDTYVPDFDLYIWDWAGYCDPGQTLSAQVTAQIGNTNEPCWSNAEYDKLNDEQAAEMDPARRKDLIDRMQQIMYEQTPWVVLTYPKYLQAYNDAARGPAGYACSTAPGPPFSRPATRSRTST